MVEHSSRRIDFVQRIAPRAAMRRHAHNACVVAHRYFEQGALEEAQQHLRRALQHDPHSMMALRLLANVEFGLEHPAAARGYLSRILTVTPDDTDALLLQGRIAISEGDPRTAVEIYLRIEAAGHHQPELTFYLGLAHLMLGNGEEAADAFTRLLAEIPTHERAWDGLGCARRLLKDYTGAINAFLHALQVDPAMNDARDHLAQVLLETGNFPRAKQFLEYAITLEPERASSRHLLGLVHAAGQDYGAAAACWETLVAQHNALPETYHMLANAYLHLDNTARAVQVLEILVESFPDHLPGHLQLALLLLEHGERSRGWRHLEQARAIDPGNPTVNHAFVVAQAISTEYQHAVDP